MTDAFYLAGRYLLHYTGRSAIVLSCLVLVAILPVGLERILDESEESLTARADATPLLIGSRGSALDLVLGTVYFGGQAPDPVSMREIGQMEDTGLAYAIPVHTGFSARGAPIVGTTVDYLDFRGLTVADGRSLAVLGECLLGADAAARLGLTPGDSLVSSPETVFDLAGVYPLKMNVVGVLAAAGTPDDLAVFVDIKTAWIIQGLGHGHQDLAGASDPSLVIAREGDRVVGSAKVVEYQEVTDDNRDSFHFHGDPSGYPVTGGLIVPDDERAGTLLLGRFVEADGPFQIVRPRAIVAELMETIFRIKGILDGAVAVVAVAAVLALVLVFALSFRLRAAELRTNFELGASRGTTARLLGAELVMLGVVAAVLVGLCLVVLERFIPLIVRSLFVT